MPTLAAIVRRAGHCRQQLRGHFPDLCAALVAHQHRLPIPAPVQAGLQAALQEQPPPSLECVARRVGLFERAAAAALPRWPRPSRIATAADR